MVIYKKLEWFELTAYEQMAKFEIGLDMGLLTLDELREFINGALKQKEVPYIYTDVFLSLDKGQEEVINVIFYNLQGNYTADRNAGNTVQRSLIGIIRDKYRAGTIDKERCVELLHRLTDYSDGDWNLLSIDEYYKLNKTGYCSDADFEESLKGIFDMGI